MKKYDTSSILDEDLMYSEIISAMKSFGNDITVLKEDVVEVRDFKATLPQDFYGLKGAMMLEPIRCNKKAIEYRTVLGISYVTDVKALSDRWDNCDECCHDITENFYRKVHYIANSVDKAEVDYRKTKWLKIGKSLDRKSYLKDMRKNWLSEEKDEITITNNTINANFKSGSVYLLYKGFVTDDDGYIDVPETRNGYLHAYLVQRLMNSVYEWLIINGENVNSIQALLQLGMGRERTFRHNAGTELKNFNPMIYASKISKLEHQTAKQYSLIGR